MIHPATPPVLIPPPEPLPWLAQMMPESGTEGAGWLVWTAIACSLVFVTGACCCFVRGYLRGADDAPSTDTPETDDAVARWAVRRDATTIIECSRRLERKLAEATERAIANSRAEASAKALWIETTQELAEARATIATNRDEAGGLVDEFLHRLLNEVTKRGVDMSSCDGDDPPEVVVAGWMAGEIMDTRKQLAEANAEVARLRRAREE